jgi:TPR repeat protein
MGRPAAGSQARAAYELGMWCEREGDLECAAHWFRRAAEDDYPDAALRLGGVLARLVDEADEQDTKTDQSPEMLLAEATRWLSEVKASPDAVELITDLLNRQQRLAARRTIEPLTVG